MKKDDLAHVIEQVDQLQARLRHFRESLAELDRGAMDTIYQLGQIAKFCHKNRKQTPPAAGRSE